MVEKIDIIIEQLKNLTLLEAAELVKEMEKTFGIDTTVSMPSIPVVAANSSSASATPAESSEEQTTFNITLSEVPGDKKIAILKVVRALTGLGLKESKDIVENVPKIIKEGVTKEESEKIKKELEEAGGKVKIA
jgi:large subunit ribosomal protein L7/L12